MAKSFNPSKLVKLAAIGPIGEFSKTKKNVRSPGGLRDMTKKSPLMKYKR